MLRFGVRLARLVVLATLAPFTALLPVGAVAQTLDGLIFGGEEGGILTTRSRPGPGGSPHYEMELAVELPESLMQRATQIIQ